MFMEYVNRFGLKLFIMEEFLNHHHENTDLKVNDKGWSLKQSVAVMNHWLKINLEYLATLERGKPDDTLYFKQDEMSDRVASLIERKDDYQKLVKMFKLYSEEMIQKLKTCKNNSKKNLSEFLMDQFFYFSRIFGRIEETVRLLSLPG